MALVSGVAFVRDETGKSLYFSLPVRGICDAGLAVASVSTWKDEGLGGLCGREAVDCLSARGEGQLRQALNARS